VLFSYDLHSARSLNPIFDLFEGARNISSFLFTILSVGPADGVVVRLAARVSDFHPLGLYVYLPSYFRAVDDAWPARLNDSPADNRGR